MSCDYNCENNCEECEYPDLVLNFVKGYNQALEDVLNCVEWDGYTFDIKERIENLKK